MLDLLLLFYNRSSGPEPDVLIDHLIPVTDFLKKFSVDSQLASIALLNLMVDLVTGIVAEVRNKLLFRACYRYQIILTDDDSD